MNILILGSGGREHALAWAVQQNPKCDKLIVAPGNAGIAQMCDCAAININDGDAVVSLELTGPPGRLPIDTGAQILTEGMLGSRYVNLLPGAFAMPRDQYGIDLYWKLLATPNLWVTPGVQFIFDPSLNPTTDHLTVLGFKVRWFF